MEAGTGVGTWIAYAAIVLFFIILALVVVRTIVLLSGLLILPVGRVLRCVPGLRGVIEELEARAAAPARDRR